jgi:hypothetical protein
VTHRYRLPWSDCGGDLYSSFSRDELLTNVTLYWMTETISSSFRMYYEGRRTPLHFAEGEFVRPSAQSPAFPGKLTSLPESSICESLCLPGSPPREVQRGTVKISHALVRLEYQVGNVGTHHAGDSGFAATGSWMADRKIKARFIEPMLVHRSIRLSFWRWLRCLKKTNAKLWFVPSTFRFVNGL